jgi:hypothetical protein
MILVDTSVWIELLNRKPRSNICRKISWNSVPAVRCCRQERRVTIIRVFRRYSHPNHSQLKRHSGLKENGSPKAPGDFETCWHLEDELQSQLHSTRIVREHEVGLSESWVSN